jgi:hypothetical protein
MLNFGDTFVFEKEIEVQNVPDESTVTSASKEKKKRKDNPNAKIITREDVEIEFFPESGSLISGIANIVAFKANDWSGKGANVSESIIFYNPEKQPSGKIRIEGITNDGVPFAVKLK